MGLGLWRRVMESVVAELQWGESQHMQKKKSLTCTIKNGLKKNSLSVETLQRAVTGKQKANVLNGRISFSPSVIKGKKPENLLRRSSSAEKSL